MAEPIEPVVPPVVEPVETSTEVLPSTPAATPPAQPRKRRRWIGWVIGLVVLVVLLVVGFFVADAYARDYAKGYVRDQIIQVLKLDPATKVDVDLGGGSVILQALRGSIDEVTVDVAELSFGDITGSAVITATGVPLDGAQPVDKLGIVATVSETNVRKLASFMSGVGLKTIEPGEGVITASTEFNVLGFFVIPVSVDLVPSAVDGGISFDPKTITLAGEDISVAGLRELLGRAGDLPEAGDKLVCLKNDRKKGLLNGSLWTVQTAGTVRRKKIRMTVVPEEDSAHKPLRIGVLPEFFTSEEEIPYSLRRESDVFDYGYALTVHKAQGSQWDKIVLVDESGAFREHRDRWLYTGITRAAESLTIVL